MKAATVTRFGENPRYLDALEPVASGGYEVVVDVVAAALSPRVRSQAEGSHYTSSGELPVIPGIDGVGRLGDGSLVYFLLPDTAQGAMAERAVIDVRRSVPLPQDADPLAVAAAMNPVMASWVALRQRISFTKGHKVMVFGATGNAGQAAVQVAHRLGAGEIVAAGREIGRVADLAAHGATRFVELNADSEDVARNLADAGKDVDVVVDFLWGEPTRRALYAIIPNRTRDGQTLNWIQIGSVAGAECAIPSAALRAVDLRLIGSGQGSVDPRRYREEIKILAREIGAFDIPARAVPLRNVEDAWADTSAKERIVFLP